MALSSTQSSRIERMDKLESATQIYLAHLNSIIETYNTSLSNGDGISTKDAYRIFTRSRNLVHKIVEKESPYLLELDSAIGDFGMNSSYTLEVIIGILLGLKDELSIGSLDFTAELIRGDLFENFLDMAGYLVNEGYKDAAAVITGSSLEAHLHLLAKKFGIEIEILEPTVKTRYKKAEIINQELYKAKAYSTFDQKQITAWLDLRNSAAHGIYSNYAINQVVQFIEWTKDFISKHSA
jgi:hypothetical protein